MFSESLVGLFSEGLTVFSERQRKVTNVIRTDQIFCVFFFKNYLSPLYFSKVEIFFAQSFAYSKNSCTFAPRI